VKSAPQPRLLLGKGFALIGRGGSLQGTPTWMIDTRVPFDGAGGWMHHNQHTNERVATDGR
jgi:hypothetical protein